MKKDDNQLRLWQLSMPCKRPQGANKSGIRSESSHAFLVGCASQAWLVHGLEQGCAVVELLLGARFYIGFNVSLLVLASMMLSSLMACSVFSVEPWCRSKSPQESAHTESCRAWRRQHFSGRQCRFDKALQSSRNIWSCSPFECTRGERLLSLAPHYSRLDLDLLMS